MKHLFRTVPLLVLSACLANAEKVSNRPVSGAVNTNTHFVVNTNVNGTPKTVQLPPYHAVNMMKNSGAWTAPDTNQATMWQLTVRARAIDSTPLTLRAFVGQDNDLFEILDSSGNGLFQVGSDGLLFSSGSTSPKFASVSTIGHVWTATDTEGHGSFQALTGGGDVTTSQLNAALTATSNGVLSVARASDNVTSNSLLAQFVANDTTTSNGVLTAARASDNVTSNSLLAQFVANDTTTSNGVLTAARASDNVTSNSLLAQFVANDTTTSNGVLTAARASDNVTSNGVLTALGTSINGGTPNGAGALVHWSEITGIPAGIADGDDASSGGGVSDGDKGDVVISGSGTAYTVESAAGAFTVSGVASNNANLHVRRRITVIGTNAAPSVELYAHSNNTPQILFHTASDIEASPSAVIAGRTLAGLEWLGYGAANYRSAFQIQPEVMTTFTGTEASTRVLFKVGNNSASTRIAKSLSAYKETNNVDVINSSNVVVLGSATAARYLSGVTNGGSNATQTVIWEGGAEVHRALMSGNMTLNVTNVPAANASAGGKLRLKLFKPTGSGYTATINLISARVIDWGMDGGPILVSGRTNEIVLDDDGTNITGINLQVQTSGNGSGSYMLTTRSNYAHSSSLTFNASQNHKGDVTNDLSGNASWTISTPVIGTSGSVSYLSDGSARTIGILCPVKLTWVSTNGTSNGTNVLTAANRYGLFCWDVRQGTNGTTNVFTWTKNQP